jgi:hypothetical protein
VDSSAGRLFADNNWAFLLFVFTNIEDNTIFSKILAGNLHHT